MKVLVGFLKPDVPGFWSSYGFVATVSTDNGIFERFLLMSNETALII